jgi:hypothetical protein
MTTVANTAVVDTSRENYVARWRALKDQYAMYQEQINALERLKSEIHTRGAELITQYEHMRAIITIMALENIDPVQAELRHGTDDIVKNLKTNATGVYNGIGLNSSISNNLYVPNQTHNLFHISDIYSHNNQLDSAIRYSLQSHTMSCNNSINRYHQGNL